MLIRIALFIAVVLLATTLAVGQVRELRSRLQAGCLRSQPQRVLQGVAACPLEFVGTEIQNVKKQN